MHMLQRKKRLRKTKKKKKKKIKNTSVQRTKPSLATTSTKPALQPLITLSPTPLKPPHHHTTYNPPSAPPP